MNKICRFYILTVLPLLLLAFVPSSVAQVQNPNVNIRAVGGTAIGVTVPVSGTISPSSGATIGISSCTGATCYTSGVGAVVSVGLTTSTPFASTTLLQSMRCNNQSTASVNFTVTDGNNLYYVGPNYAFPASSNGEFNPSPIGSILAAGVKMSASAANSINCWLVGKQ